MDAQKWFEAGTVRLKLRRLLYVKEYLGIKEEQESVV